MLEKKIRDSIKPQLRTDLIVVEGFNNSYVIVLRIPQSISAPHMVAYQNTSRFYSRNSTGKYQLDVEGIKSAFIASEALSERIKRFREQRLAQIIEGKTLVLQEEGARLVVHLIPLAAFHHTPRPEIVFPGEVEEKIQNAERGSEFRYNLDGYLAYRLGEKDKNRTYLQVFRRGEMEYVDCNILGEKEHKTIPGRAFEEDTIAKVAQYLKLMKGLGVETPILIMISLLGVKDWRLGYPVMRSFRNSPRSIDRDALIIPYIRIEDYDKEASHILKPVFDTIWQACGFPCSSNYDADGDWNPK
jgi:hypothetical protein